MNYTAPFVTGYRDTSSYQTLVYSKLIILNGFNPAETIFETNSNYYLGKAKDAGAKIVVIDPRLSETAATFADEWLPLKPTTDSALFVAMAYVIVTENLHDQAFLDKYCIGFDEKHMPKSVPEGHSFTTYVLGLADGTPKTPEWAARITGVEANVIRSLAREYATTNPAQLIQGLGPQRHAHGEESVRAGITLACMTGNLGKLGGGWGGGEGGRRLGLPLGGIPSGINPIKTRIPVFLWTDAIVRGTEMTAEDGVKDGPLRSNIKFIFNIAGNALLNQHADINRTIQDLQDENCANLSSSRITSLPPARSSLMSCCRAIIRWNATISGFPGPAKNHGVRQQSGRVSVRMQARLLVAEPGGRKLGLGQQFTEVRPRMTGSDRSLRKPGKPTRSSRPNEELKQSGRLS